MNNKKLRPVFIIIAIILIAYFGYEIILSPNHSDDTLISTKVKRGDFSSLIYSTGQLQAENSVSINVPSELSGSSLRIYEIKVTQIIEEGSVVDSGDFVASLDHSAVEEKLTDAMTTLNEKMDEYDDAKIDTNINLSNLRDDLLTSQINMEEKKLVLDQSKYESPAVIRQAKLDLDKAQRKYEQDERNYKLKKKQDEYKVQRAANEVKKAQERVNEIKDLFEAIDIKAPAPGMLIYSYDRQGNKIKVGSTVSRWAPTIAELPDLSSMISKTFINEVDISRIEVGQKVKVGVDAFPEKHFDGEVTDVANIGQVIPGGDSKVFEVSIKIFGSDSDLRPAMTTSNVITTDTLRDVLFIPLESVFQNDSLSYVYVDKGTIKKQIIDMGATNENFVVINQGLQEGDVIYLNQPSNDEEIPFKGIEIYEEQKAKQIKEKEAEKTAKQSSNEMKHEKAKRIMNRQPSNHKK